MPAALERKLKKEATKKGLTGERKDAYTYGTLRKTGWKPSREKKMEAISSSMDSIIRFDDQNKFPWLATGTAAAGGVGAAMAHQAIMKSGGYRQNLAALGRGGQDLLGQATGNIAQGTGKVGGAIAEGASKAGAGISKIAGKVWNAAKGIFMESKEKEIRFGSEILGPWQGSSTHTSKIDQLEFPAGLSPAAVLKFPFPKLMAYLNQRNILQQQFGWKHQRLIELRAKLEEINA